VLQPLSEEHLVSLLRRALSDPRGLKEQRMSIGDEELRLMAARAGGDARRALNALETLSLIVAGRIDSGGGSEGPPVTRQEVDRALARAALLYDASGEEHFNLISALHKSLRNSDADAALYWLARMLESGEDPLYVARRMIRFASEDVGNADPGALRVALSARDAFVSLGMPEGALALAQAAIYLAATPKSNSVYEAYGKVIEELRRGGADPVPLALRNAPTALMRDLGYGRDYAYAHDEPEGTAGLECLPDRLRGRRFYHPKPVGHERALGERLQEMESRRAKKAAGTATAAPRPTRTDE
jgi:putative ATPase